MTTELLRIGRRLVVEQPAAGELQLRVSEWAGAPWLAAPLALVGAPLAVWSAIEGHTIELGGAVVACWFAALALWLWARGRRDVHLRRTAAGVAVSAVAGAGPLGRLTECEMDGDPALEVRPAPAPPDAPATPDPGADLVLVCGDSTLHLARLFGPRTARLEAGRERLTQALIPALP